MAYNRGVVQLASILAWGASGRPFESGRSDKNKKASTVLWMLFFGFHNKVLFLFISFFTSMAYSFGVSLVTDLNAR